MNKRKENELFVDYKARQRAEHREEKRKKRHPNVLWDVTRLGTYCKKEHGPLTF